MEPTGTLWDRFKFGKSFSLLLYFENCCQVAKKTIKVVKNYFIIVRFFLKAQGLIRNGGKLPLASAGAKESSESS